MPNKIFKMSNVPKKLIDAGEKEYYKKNDIIIHAGDLLDSIYILVKGKIVVITYTLTGVMVYDFLLVPPCVIGQTHALNKKEMSATLKCIEDVEVLKISLSTLINILKSDINIVMYLYEITFKLVENYSYQAREYATLSSEEQIAHILVEFAEVLGEEIDGKIKINFKFSHQFIGDFVGVTRQTAITIFKKLKQRNIISKSNGYYYINNLAALKDIK